MWEGGFVVGQDFVNAQKNVRRAQFSVHTGKDIN